MPSMNQPNRQIGNSTTCTSQHATTLPLIRSYSETFNQDVPPEVLRQAAENVLAPELMEKLDAAIKARVPVKVWGVAT